MATEYISKEKAVEKIWSVKVTPKASIFDALKQCIEEEIKHIPAADVRPVVRAVWLAEKDGVGICSNCKRLDHIDPLATHCRYCGADMRKKGGREDD